MSHQKIGQAWLKREDYYQIKDIDTLILDIDGIILDVYSSFRKVISQTVQYFFKNHIKLEGKVTLLSPAETQLFKLAGGFNNDWELTEAAILFFLSKMVSLSIKNLDELKRIEPLAYFTEKVKFYGGGLKGAKKAIFEKLKVEEREKVKKEWKRKLIRQVFQEIYGGIDWCEKLYGFKPKKIFKKGLVNKERVIIDLKMIKKFPKLGILTGRTREETELALKKANLEKLIPFDFILYDDGKYKKPNPLTLEKLGSLLGTKKGLYLGDAYDDWLTVKNFSQKEQKFSFFSGIVFRSLKEFKIYRAEGVTILARSPNDILKAVVSLKE